MSTNCARERSTRWRGSISIAVVLQVGTVHAGPRATLGVAGDEHACPSPSQVATVLRSLLRETNVVTTKSASSSDDVSLSDDGSQFRVTVAGRSREFDDAQRDCTERARHAAVFVALVLDPPLVADPIVESAPPPAEKPAAPIVSSREHAAIDLELGSFFQASPAAAERSAALAGGVEMRGRWGQRIYVAGGVGASPGSLRFADIDTRAWWFPIDLAVGAAYRSSSFEVAGDFGPSMTVLSIAAENLTRATNNVRLDLGARLSLGARFWLSEKIALSVSTQGTFIPRPYRLVIEGEGDVGATPGVWWGGTIGFVTRLD
jgi:hypothetical protein